MSQTTTNTGHTSPDAKKSDCCGGGHGTDNKVPHAAKAHAVTSADDKHEPAQKAHGGSCGCGSGKANK